MIRYSIFLTIVFCCLVGSTRIIRLKPGIIDGAGYAIRNSRYADQDLAMEANAATENILGVVTLTPFANSPSQKWGVEFYGGSTASLTSGANRDNFVTSYLPQGSSRPQSRQYKFESSDDNETFLIRNSETKMCLCAVQRNDRLEVSHADCTDTAKDVYWTFQRTG